MTVLLPMKSKDDPLRTNWPLIGRIQNPDDAKSWHDFDEQYRGLIFRIAKREGLRDAEAEDVVQETMASVAKNIKNFEADPRRGSFRSWLLQMARWRIQDQRQKRLPSSSPTQRSENNSATTATVERIPDPQPVNFWEADESAWHELLIQRALPALQIAVNPRDYQIFHLLQIENKTVTEVAQMVDCNRAQIYLIKHRVGKALSRIVKKMEKAANQALPPNSTSMV
jgi:RNA polymerase sigma factor (sigma-70 family)